MSAPGEGRVTFALDLGIDDVSIPESVQPIGDGASLTSSVNTRLYQRGVVNKSPLVTQIATFGSGADCGGVIPAGHVDSSVAFFRAGAGGNIRISGSETADLDGALSANPANTYWPAQVSRAGAVPGARSNLSPAVCYLSGNTYYATVRNYGATDFSSVGIYITVVDDDDRVVVSPTLAATVSSSSSWTDVWVGLTAHGANGVRLWWNDSGVIKGASVTVSGLAITVGTPASIYTPNSIFSYSVSASSNGDDDYAYLASISSSTDADLAVHKVDVNALTASTTTKTSFTGTSAARISVTHIVISGTGYLAVTVMNFSSGETKCTLYTTSAMTNAWTSSALQASGTVGAQFYVANGSSYVVAAASDYTGDLSTQDTVSTAFGFLDLATGTLAATTTMHWLRLVGSGATHQISATEIYPYFPMQHAWDYTNVATNNEFLLDPSIEVYTVNGTSKLSPLARLGYNQAVRYGTTGPRTAFFSKNSVMVGSKLLVAYLQDRFTDAYSQDGYVVRYAELDLDAGQPRFAVMPEGGAVIAAALPAVWDGSEVAELSPLHQPRVYATATGGSGDDFAAGDYQIRAVVSWKDSTGEIVRSLPSPAVTISPSGTDKPKIWVYPPASMKNGTRQERASVQLYVTLTDGTVFYAQTYSASSIGNDYWVFTNVTQPVSGYLNPLIYSTGSATSPLASECPGAIWDVACVGNRLWMINAENRSEAMFTKPKQLGVRFEWNYVNTVPFPASAGKLMAVADSNGTPLFLTTTGLYQVAGEGPDANGQGQQFSKPFLVGTTRCTDRNSVVTTPAGVMFVSGDKFALFGGGAIRLFDADASNLGSCVGVAHFRDYDEIVWFGIDVAYVYNYIRDRFTTWSSATLRSDLMSAVQVPTNGKAILTSTADSKVYLMDPDQVSTTAQIAVGTGWVTLGGPHDDFVFRDLIVYARRGGVHGLSVSVEMDYGAGVDFTKTFSAAEITAGAQDGKYTLPIQFASHGARSFRLTLSETDGAGAGFRPVNATVVYGQNPGVARKSFMHALRK